MNLYKKNLLTFWAPQLALRGDESGVQGSDLDDTWEKMILRVATDLILVKNEGRKKHGDGTKIWKKNKRGQNKIHEKKYKHKKKREIKNKTNRGCLGSFAPLCCSWTSQSSSGWRSRSQGTNRRPTPNPWSRILGPPPTKTGCFEPPSKKEPQQNGVLIRPARRDKNVLREPTNKNNKKNQSGVLRKPMK